MRVLRDYYCELCGEVQCDIVGDVTQVLPCSRCRCATEHRDMCNGARHSRFHWNDFGTVPLEALCTYEGAGAAQSSDGRGGANVNDPVKNTRTGKAIHDDPKYAPDARAERAARRKHASEKRRGRGRIYGPTSGLQKASNGN